MISTTVLNQFNQLPEDKKNEVADFIEFLLSKNSRRSANKKAYFGFKKGKYKMSDDFDEPLEGFEEYC